MVLHRWSVIVGILPVMRAVVRAIGQLFGDPEGRGLVILVGGLVAGGSAFYRWVEDMTWIDSVYFTVITLTTVGYGDLAPATTAGKLFTMFYVLVGVGLLVAFVSEVARRTMDAHAERRSEQHGNRER